MIPKNKEIVIIGCGIVGLAIGRKFTNEGYKNIKLLEKNLSSKSSIF